MDHCEDNGQNNFITKILAADHTQYMMNTLFVGNDTPCADRTFDLE